MAAKNPEQVRKAEVESAIHGLRDLVPEPKYGECKNIVTAETLALTKQINARKRELDKDAKLVKLQATLTAERCRVAVLIKERKAKIDALLRRLRLRGVTDELVADIEKFASEPVVKLINHDCE